MKTVTVTGGEVTLRERADLTVRQREGLQEQIADLLPVIQPLQPFISDSGEVDEEGALAAGVLTREALHAFFAATRALVVTAIHSWTLTNEDGTPLAPPTTVDEVGDLNGAVYDELAGEVAPLGLMGEVNFEPSDPKAPGFTETPTPPSVA